MHSYAGRKERGGRLSKIDALSHMESPLCSMQYVVASSTA